MANLTARALDTWLNTLNKAHLIPVNAATFLRSVIAKQLGDKNFRPAEITDRNFTDAELDALLRLARRKDGTFGPITHSSYSDGFEYDYGNGEGPLESYFSPIKDVSTSAGQMNYDKAKNALTDTYDFNREKYVVFDQGDGTFRDEVTDTIHRNEDAEKFKSNILNHGNAYSNLRNNAHRLAHQDSDPDSGKIKFNVSIDKALKRLGKKFGTYDVTKPMSKREFLTKAVLAAGATGAPIGAALGAVSGALTLIDRKKRKRWLRQIATHSLAGAALGGLASGALGGFAANKLSNEFRKPFEKIPEFEKDSEDVKEKRKKEVRVRALSNLLAYGVPVAAVAGAGAYAGIKTRNLYKTLLEDRGSRFGIDLIRI